MCQEWSIGHVIVGYKVLSKYVIFFFFNGSLLVLWSPKAEFSG